MEETKNSLFERIFLKSWRPYVWIVLIGFLIYFQILSFEFVYFDDDLLIINNQEFISDISNIIESFKEDVFISFFDVYYRPILTISFIIDAQFGGLEPFVYHLSNIIIHLLSSCLVFILLLKLKYKRELAFFFSLIFIIHPVLSQAVGWIPGRNDSLLAIFLLPAFIFFLNFIETKTARRWFYFLLHLLFFILAIFTKETAIFILPIIILYLIFIYKERLFSSNKILLISGWLLVFICWFFLRKGSMENPLIMNIGEMIQSSIVGLPAAIQYIGKIIFPFNLAVFPIMVDTTFIYGLVATILIIALVIISKNKRINFIIFGLLWFILLILPTLIFSRSVAIPTFLEHRMYLPMIGLFIILLETNLIKNLTYHRKKLLTVGIVTVLLFSVINFIHSKNFNDRLTFWENAANNSPHSGFVQRELGYIYYLDNRINEAKKQFEKSLELNPKELLAHYHLGNIYLNKNMLEEAAAEYKKELEIDPLFDNALFNLALVYFKQGDINNAKFYWEKTIESNPEHSEALNSLGLIYINEKNYSKAAEVLNKAVEYDSEFYGAYQNLGLLYFQLEEFDQAESAWLKAVEINPKLIKVHENLAILYLQKDNIEKAIFHVQEILDQDGEVQQQLLQALEQYLNSN